MMRRVAKRRNSLAVRIPQAGANRLVSKKAKRIPTLEELVAQITPENRHEEIDWGPAVGKEIVGW